MLHINSVNIICIILLYLLSFTLSILLFTSQLLLQGCKTCFFVTLMCLDQSEPLKFKTHTLNNFIQLFPKADHEIHIKVRLQSCRRLFTHSGSQGSTLLFTLEQGMAFFLIETPMWFLAGRGEVAQRAVEETWSWMEQQ